MTQKDPQPPTQQELLLLYGSALLGLPALAAIVALMGLAMHFLPGANGISSFIPSPFP
jgi:hypothetical protein